jgi:hypothetical protein
MQKEHLLAEKELWIEKKIQELAVSQKLLEDRELSFIRAARRGGIGGSAGGIVGNAGEYGLKVLDAKMNISGPEFMDVRDSEGEMVREGAHNNSASRSSPTKDTITPGFERPGVKERVSTYELERRTLYEAKSRLFQQQKALADTRDHIEHEKRVF